MPKINLRIKHVIDDKEISFSITAIKDKNKYIYSYQDFKFSVVKEKEEIIVKIINKESINEIFFKNKESFGIFHLGDNDLTYKLEIIKMSISEKKIEIDYKIDAINKFILEEIND